jgi:HK97 gp10 family phage protein
MLIGKSFSIESNNLDKLIKQITVEARKDIDGKILKKVKNITEEAYAIAKSKRPDMTNASGRKVSDPNAAYGVPVRTGVLRSSIKREVNQSGEKTIGRVYTDKTAPYDIYLEFGTSRITPRPFMGDALREIQPKIKEILKK